MNPPRSRPVVVDIAVCTFQRPQLEATLRSLAELVLPPDAAVQLIVADNDRSPSARDLVARLSPLLPFPVQYLHVPAGNISLARNACLDAAGGDFVAFTDDDATCAPAWLAELLGTALSSGADVVLGPVGAAYAAGTPDWVRRGNFHSVRPVWVNGAIRTGYTGNVLIRRACPAVAGRRFNLALGKTGGEDTEYFGGVHHAGGVIGFASNAWTFEDVPLERARFGWLARRHFRSGQTHGRLTAGRRPGAATQAAAIGAAAAKAGYCFALAGLTLPWAARRNANLLRGLMHAGAVGGLLGVREITQYGQLEETTG